jgi:hypothetical protein
MRYVLGVLATLMLGSAAIDANAQAPTPPNCHWSPKGGDPSVIEMWCRGDDGQARATGRTMRQVASSADGCPAGQLYDGERCVSEAKLMSRLPTTTYVAPAPATPQPTAKQRPRVLMFQDAGGRHRQGMACADTGGVTVCQPVPRY